MRKIGIMTGAGPGAGIDLWQKIINEQKAFLGIDFKGDLDAPAVVVFSVPELGMAMDMEQNQQKLWHVMVREMEAMALHVDLICIACNVLHLFIDQLRALRLPAEIVSIVEVVEDYLIQTNVSQVGLLSISSVMALGPLSPYAVLQRRAKLVTSATPSEMDDLIRDIKRGDAGRVRLREVYERQVRNLGVNRVLLACTELPLVSRPIPGIEQIDVTMLLARAMVRKSWEGTARRDVVGSLS